MNIILCDYKKDLCLHFDKLDYSFNPEYGALENMYFYQNKYIDPGLAYNGTLVSNNVLSNNSVKLSNKIKTCYEMWNNRVIDRPLNTKLFILINETINGKNNEIIEDIFITGFKYNYTNVDKTLEVNFIAIKQIEVKNEQQYFKDLKLQNILS